MNTLTTWHHSPKARAILASISAQDFHMGKVPGYRGGLNNEYETRPITDAGISAFERLEALRRSAIDTALGYTFDSTMSPYDDAKAHAYLDVMDGALAVSAAIDDHLAKVDVARAA